MTEPKTANKFLVLAPLFLVGGVLSGILFFEHFGVGAASAAVEEICGADDVSGCDDVASSAYATIGGISLAGIGLAFYASLLLLCGLGLAASESVQKALGGLALALVGLALLGDLLLLGIQTFEIGAYCSLCIGTYVVNAASLALLWPLRGSLGRIGSSLGGEARSVIPVWFVGSFLLFASTLAVEHALGSLNQDQHATLLGGAPEIETPFSSTPGEGGERAPTARAEEDVEGDSERSEGEVQAFSSSSSVSEQGEGDGVDDGAAAQTTAEPSHSGSGSGDERVARLETQLARARAENETLRETLDDPEKYQQYQMEKATREFEAAEAHEIALDGIPYKGPEGAPIRVVEYSDFLCPFCRNLAGALANFMPQSGGRVAVFFKNYPLDQACNPSLSRTVHDGACELALGAVCAQEQDAFWAYHDAIFTEPPHNPNNDDVVRIAASAGLDADAMRSCLSSNDAERKLTADIEEAKQLAVTATPTVFVNGKRLQQIGSFMMAIESEATRLGLGRD